MTRLRAALLRPARRSLPCPRGRLPRPPQKARRRLPLVFSPPPLRLRQDHGRQPSRRAVEVDLYNEGEEEAADRQDHDRRRRRGRLQRLNGSSCGRLDSRPALHASGSPSRRAAPARSTAIARHHLQGTAGRDRASRSPAPRVAPQLDLHARPATTSGCSGSTESRSAYLQLTNSGEAAVQLNSFDQARRQRLATSGPATATAGAAAAAAGRELQRPGQLQRPGRGRLRGRTAGRPSTATTFTAALSGSGGRAIIEADAEPGRLRRGHGRRHRRGRRRSP